METGNAIELKGVTKRFGDVIANDNVNLTVRKGEILSILGENGSGKTTLMNMLSGIYFPDEGEVYVDGKEVTIRSPKDSFALGIGMIHQHFKLINILTAAENIILGLPGKEKLNMKQVEKEIRKLTEQYGFDLNPSQKIYDMSVSQKQTVEHRREGPRHRAVPAAALRRPLRLRDGYRGSLPVRQGRRRVCAPR